MIGYICGTVIASHELVNTIRVGGGSSLGYEVHVNGSPGVGNLQELWIHEHVPQDSAPELYGFETIQRRDLFRRLLEIQGVGPKVAMRVVAVDVQPGETMHREELLSRLTKIRGVGRVLAERICDSMVG